MRRRSVALAALLTLGGTSSCTSGDARTTTGPTAGPSAGPTAGSATAPATTGTVPDTDQAPTPMPPSGASPTSPAPAVPPTPTASPSSTDGAAGDPAGRLQALVVAPPAGLEAVEPGTAGQASGPFDATTFVQQLSNSPREDAALLANTGFLAGHHLFARAPSGNRWLHVYLYRFATAAGARALLDGFWAQGTHTGRFAVPGVPGALSQSSTVTTGSGSYVQAAVDFAVGDVMVQLVVASQKGAPDIAAAVATAQEQYRLLAAS